MRGEWQDFLKSESSCLLIDRFDIIEEESNIEFDQLFNGISGAGRSGDRRGSE